MIWLQLLGSISCIVLVWALTVRRYRKILKCHAETAKQAKDLINKQGKLIQMYKKVH